MKSTPANTTANTVKKKEGGLPEHLEVYKWQPGESGNRNGRPKRLPFTERYKAICERPVTVELLKQLGMDPKAFKHLLNKKLTVGDAIALNMARIGMTETKFAGIAAKEMREPIEGKAVQRLSGPDGESLVPPKLTVNFVKREKK